MALSTLTTVPAGTVVKISVKLPQQLGGGFDGFQWTTETPMSVAAARDSITRKLLDRFFDHFLPAE